MDTFDRIEKTVYIAGKVTGLPRWFVVLKFWFWQTYFELKGYEVKNPVKFIGNRCKNEKKVMACCINVLSYTCQYIFMIPGWRKSKGANKEFKHAAKLELTCLNFGNTKWQFDIRVMMHRVDREQEGKKLISAEQLDKFLERFGTLMMIDDMNNLN
jgi:hypothetical protein